jgi:hypothetical protein
MRDFIETVLRRGAYVYASKTLLSTPSPRGGRMGSLATGPIEGYSVRSGDLA